MKKISIELENCFGIKKLKQDFHFTACNVNAIYAKNGLMKTSFSKTFERIQKKKSSDIKDEIFGMLPVVIDIKINEVKIKNDEIFVIKTFENSYQSESIASLLVNENSKKTIENLLKAKDNLFKALALVSGLKISKISLGKKIPELENTIINDFSFVNKSFLLNINEFSINSFENDYSNILYSSIFDDSVLKKISSENFQNKIKDYLIKNDEIYAEYDFLQKGSFTLAKLKEINKRISDNNYFVKENKLYLTGNSSPITSTNDLNNQIIKVENHLKDTKEFKEIEDLLSDVKGMGLKDIIEKNPEIVKELMLDNLDEFRKKLWLSYLKSEEQKFIELKDLYNNFKVEINKTEFDNTPWKEALDIFESRFTVPFKMEIDNLKSSIIGESLPIVIFKFCKDGNKDNLESDNWVELNRDELEGKDILSQGEKRALYLLNIIFDIRKRNQENKKTLFIIDDIADSFDYKNKYAIIEYLKEISEIEGFYMIILTHNFDFYRIVSSRLNLDDENRFHVLSNRNEIFIKKEKYQNQPFIYWKKNLFRRHIIALIPFVRNLIEYGVDNKVFDNNNDFIFLTKLLHDKEDSSTITFEMLKKVYKHYIGNDNFLESISPSETIIESINEIANNITDNDIDLEYKIILAIAIRLKAEKFMKNSINNSNQEFDWKEKNSLIRGDSNMFLSYIENKKHQTRELFNGYIQISNSKNIKEEIKILNRVNIMTPENIHLNSFMYEPILDMDIWELKNLYNDVSTIYPLPIDFIKNEDSSKTLQYSTN